MRMNARVEEPSHRHGIAEHKDRHARPKSMRSLIVSPWGSGCNSCRPGMRAPAACGGGLRPEIGGLRGYGTALRWSRRHTSIASRIHVVRLHAAQPKVSRIQNCGAIGRRGWPGLRAFRRTPVLRRAMPGHDGRGRQMSRHPFQRGVFGRDERQRGACAVRVGSRRRMFRTPLRRWS